MPPTTVPPGVEAIRELARELRRDDVQLIVARVRPQVRDLLEAGEVVDVIGADRFFPTVRAAVVWCPEHDTADEPQAPS